MIVLQYIITEVMTMSSSLQQMAAASLEGASSSDGASTQQPQKNKNTNTTNNNTFESCFSAGLDLSEFAQNNSGSNSNIPQHTIVAASAELAQQKLNNVAHRKNEEREEVILERRAADIVSAAKQNSNTSIDDTLGNVIPRATNPHNKTASSISTAYDTIDIMEDQQTVQEDGRSRDDNFVQFQDSSHTNEFLSCLVSNHKIEDEEGRFISHKSRMTKKKQQMQHKKKSLGISGSGSGSRASSGMAHSRRQEKKHHTKIKSTPGSGRKGVAKKSRKSKY